jgi:hypothetical protein
MLGWYLFGIGPKLVFDQAAWARMASKSCVHHWGHPQAWGV